MSREVGKSGRYLSIDGMRGAAALSVVIYHMALNMKEPLEAWVPSWIMSIVSYGYLGVPFFFVISGFVIATSIGESHIDRSYTGSFVLRRSIRLDPTYWVSIFLFIALNILKGRVFGQEVNVPSAGNVLAHMFYLQELLEVRPIISVVYWTLCQEVQLYLYFIFSLWLCQWIALKLAVDRNAVHLVLMLGTGVISLMAYHNYISLGINGLFIPFWHFFLLGVLVSLVYRGVKYCRILLLLWLLVELLFQVTVDLRPSIMAGLLATVMVWSGNSLGGVLTGVVFQYLGRISYTLYIIHSEIAWKLLSLSKHVFGNDMAPWLSGLSIVAGISISIVAAHILHVLVEKPSLKLSARLKKRKPETDSGPSLNNVAKDYSA